MQLCRDLVLEDKDAVVVIEESVNIFEGPIGCLGVEEICGWNEAEASYRPYDPELVPKIGDT
jgi:hypothetical protein